jgi:hypothetical protein
VVEVDGVGDRVFEAVGTDEAGFRRVGEAAVVFEFEAAEKRFGVADDGRGIALVVGEDALRVFDPRRQPGCRSWCAEAEAAASYGMYRSRYGAMVRPSYTETRRSQGGSRERRAHGLGRR